MEANLSKFVLLSVLPLEIQLSREEEWDPINRLEPTTLEIQLSREEGWDPINRLEPSTLEIQLSREEGWDPINRLEPTHCCACLKTGPIFA
jgi:hypothetical protein